MKIDINKLDIKKVMEPHQAGISCLHIRAAILYWRNCGNTQTSLTSKISEGNPNSNLNDTSVSDWINLRSFPTHYLADIARIFSDGNLHNFKLFADQEIERSNDTVIKYVLKNFRNSISPPSVLRNYLNASENELSDPLYDISPRGKRKVEWVELYCPPKLEQATKNTSSNSFSISNLFQVGDSKISTIEGAGGMGKSSLLRYIRHMAWHDHEKIGLSQKHIAIFIDCQWVEFKYGDEAFYVLQESFFKSNSSYLETVSKSILRQIIEDPDTPCLILFDALDQTPTADGQIDAASFIFDLSKLNTFKNGKNRILVTGREGVNEHFKNIANNYNICALSREDFNYIIDKWLGKGATKFVDLLSTPDRRAIDQTIRQCPFFLTLALSYFCDNFETLPNNIVEFCENLFLKTTQKWKVGPNIHSDVALKADSVLAKIAFHQISHGVKRLDERFLVSVANDYFSVLPECEKNYILSKTYTSQFILLIKSNQTFLNQLLVNQNDLDTIPLVFEWVHIHFRDYFAATVLLTDAACEDYLDFIHSNLFDDWKIAAAYSLLMMKLDKKEIIIKSLIEDDNNGTQVVIDYLRFGGETNEAIENKIEESLREHIINEQDDFGTCKGVFTSFVMDKLEQASNVPVIEKVLKSYLESNNTLNQKAKSRIEKMTDSTF